MIAGHIKALMTDKDSSAIRRMFEEGIALKKLHGEENVFDFSLGNPDLDPPEKVARAVREEAGNASHGRHGYMPNAGYPFVRDALAEKVGREQGVPVSGADIVVTAGAACALNCVLKAVLSPGDEVLVPAPFFAEYRHYARNHGGTLVEVPTKADFSLDCAAMGARLSDRTAAVLINTPNNPTGRVYPADDLRSLAAVLREHAHMAGRVPYLICDEPYRAITYDGVEVPPVFQLYDSSVVVSSFAKDLSVPGERIGYIAVNPRAEDAPNLVAGATFALRTLGFVNAPAFFQKVIARSWDAEADYSSYRSRRDALMAVLDKAGLEYARPDGAFYLFVKVPRAFGGDDMAFCEHLKKHLILGAPGGGFGGKGWFRLAYCVSEGTIARSEKAFVSAMSEL